ncbi:MAG: hypothetical protein ACRDWW_10560 [Acidimicrobiales bacterium]
MPSRTFRACLLAGSAGYATNHEEALMRSVDLFIAAELPPGDMAAELGRVAGSSCAPGPEPGTWVLQEGGTRAFLAQHRYADDGDLLLSRYRYALSARVADTVRPQDTPEAALLRMVGRRLQQGSRWPVLMVLDLQYRHGLGHAPDGSEPEETGTQTHRDSAPACDPAGEDSERAQAPDPTCAP